VAAVKEEVRAALANRDAAWDAFLADKQAKIAAARDQIEETRARVAAVKEEVRAALANRDAAWDAFLADKQAKIAAARADGQVPRGLALLEDDIAAGPPALGRRKQVFVRNLQDINRRNADADDLLAFGINDFTHLSAKEFKDVYLTSVLPSAGAWGGGQAARLGERPLAVGRGRRGCLDAVLWPKPRLNTQNAPAPAPNPQISPWAVGPASCCRRRVFCSATSRWPSPSAL
jgi:hypothetical protein